MSLIGAEFIVEVHGILADQSVLGQSITGTRGELKYQVDLPATHDAFKFMHAGPAQPESSGGAPDPRAYEPTTAVVGKGGPITEIRLIRVRINVPTDLSVDDHDSFEDVEAYQQMFSELSHSAVQIASDLCDWLRLREKQPWIEPRGEYPQVVNITSLADLDAEHSFGVAMGRLGQFRVVAREGVLNAESLARIEQHLRKGTPATDEILLAESLHLIHGQEASAQDRATLLAAIALELRTKRLLRLLAEPDRTDLLDLLLENPRDWSMSAHGLFKTALPVLARRQLGEEHTQLAKRVQQVFTARNRVAHTGQVVAPEDAKQHVTTAQAAFAFMDGLEPGDEPGSEAGERHD